MPNAITVTRTSRIALWTRRRRTNATMGDGSVVMGHGRGEAHRFHHPSPIPYDLLGRCPEPLDDIPHVRDDEGVALVVGQAGLRALDVGVVEDREHGEIAEQGLLH